VAVVALITIALRYAVHDMSQIVLLIGCGMVSSLAYLWMMAKSGSGWALYLTRRVA